MGFIGPYYASMKVNSLDLSPNYAGSLMAVTNGIGALTGIAAPSFVGLMTPNVSNILMTDENKMKGELTYVPLDAG